MIAQTKTIEALHEAPFKKELQAYLISLASAATGKPKPPPEFIRHIERENSTFVTVGDIHSIMDHMKQIFTEEGYLPQRELENKLMKKICPGMLTDSILERADEAIAGEFMPDHLTGFMQKPLVPLSTAEGWLYGHMTGKPVFMFEIDFSNMRGTNEFYEQKLRTLHPNQPQHETAEQAMALTDQAALAVSRAITKTLDETIASIAPKARYTSLRSGGDEARIIVSDIEEKDIPALIADIHKAIEIEIEKRGLQNHPHAKDPSDATRNGFGAALAAIKLNGMTNLAEAILDADDRIKEAKQEIGKKRLQKAQAASPDDIREAVVCTVFDNKSQQEQNSGVISLLNRHNDNKRVLSLDEIREAAFEHVKNEIEWEMEQYNEAPHPAALRLLETKINRYPALDFASGTLMPRDQPAIASLYADVLEKEFHDNKEDEIPTLWGLGISFHNLSGINETLGHEVANAFLYHTANEIIKPALHKRGIPDTHFTLAHYGGGEFRAIIAPPYEDTGYSISGETMDALTKDIETRLLDMNRVPLTGFMTQYGLSLDESEDIPATFKDIPHGKPDQRPWHNGLNITAISLELPIFENGTEKRVRTGSMLNRIGNELETRKTAILQTRKPAAKPSSP